MLIISMKHLVRGTLSFLGFAAAFHVQWFKVQSVYKRNLCELMTLMSVLLVFTAIQLTLPYLGPQYRPPSTFMASVFRCLVKFRIVMLYWFVSLFIHLTNLLHSYRSCVLYQSNVANLFLIYQISIILKVFSFFSDSSATCGVWITVSIVD